jgi:hypothetical protein
VYPGAALATARAPQAAGRRPVLDDELLAQRPPQVLGDQPRHDVVAAPAATAPRW